MSFESGAFYHLIEVAVDAKLVCNDDALTSFLLLIYIFPKYSDYIGWLCQVFTVSEASEILDDEMFSSSPLSTSALISRCTLSSS